MIWKSPASSTSLKGTNNYHNSTAAPTWKTTNNQINCHTATKANIN